MQAHCLSTDWSAGAFEYGYSEFKDRHAWEPVNYGQIRTGRAEDRCSRGVSKTKRAVRYHWLCFKFMKITWRSSGRHLPWKEPKGGTDGGQEKSFPSQLHPFLRHALTCILHPRSSSITSSSSAEKRVCYRVYMCLLSFVTLSLHTLSLSFVPPNNPPSFVLCNFRSTNKKVNTQKRTW